MKVNTILKEAIYIIPCITMDVGIISFNFLFITIDFKRKKQFSRYYITPFIAFSWDKGVFEFWILWIKRGVVFNFNKMKLIKVILI
jgi:hypothetical protein